MKFLVKNKSDGSEIPVEAQIVDGKLWFHLNGKTFVQDLENKKTNRKRLQSSSHDLDLSAPMPGKITKFFKGENETVMAGQAVLVMEAMKMEYTLKANAAGLIKKINCKVGEQVILGQVLVEFLNQEKTGGKK